MCPRILLIGTKKSSINSTANNNVIEFCEKDVQCFSGVEWLN